MPRAHNYKLLRTVEETGGYSPELILDLMQSKLRWRWIRTLLTPLVMLVAKRVTIENPTDAVAMLEAEDAFDVRERLPNIQTDTLVICGAQDPFGTRRCLQRQRFG